MSSLLQILKYSACAIFGFILAWNLKCCPSCPNQPVYQGSIESVTNYRDTGSHSIAYQDTGSYHVIPSPPEYIPVKVDTAAILRDYKTIKVYARHFNNDSLQATAIDTISQNKIVGTSWLKYKWLLPQTVINKQEVTNSVKNKLFVGIQLKGSATSFGAIPSVMLITKTDKAFSAGYDVLNKEIFAGAYFKLHI